MNERIFHFVNFYDCGDTLSEKEVGEFESEHGISLPEDYRNFLILVNGGRPKHCNQIHCHIEDGQFDAESGDTEVFEVLELYGLTSTGASGTNIRKLSTWVQYCDVPNSRSFIPIGTASGSNIIYMSISHDYYGEIFLGCYSYGLSKGPLRALQSDGIDPDLNVIYDDDRIATSFSHFLKSLCCPFFAKITR